MSRRVRSIVVLGLLSITACTRTSSGTVEVCDAQRRVEHFPFCLERRDARLTAFFSEGHGIEGVIGYVTDGRFVPEQSQASPAYEVHLAASAVALRDTAASIVVKYQCRRIPESPWGCVSRPPGTLVPLPTGDYALPEAADPDRLELEPQ